MQKQTLVGVLFFSSMVQETSPLPMVHFTSQPSVFKIVGVAIPNAHRLPSLTSHLYLMPFFLGPQKAECPSGHLPGFGSHIQFHHSFLLNSHSSLKGHSIYITIYCLSAYQELPFPDSAGLQSSALSWVRLELRSWLKVSRM